MKNHLLWGVLGVVIISVVAIVLTGYKTVEAPHIDQTDNDLSSTTTPTTPPPATTTPVVSTSSSTPGVPPPRPSTPVSPVTQSTFTGTLTEVNTGCFADGECYAVIGGKHVTLTIGRKQEPLGTIVGVPSIGDLESHVGEKATVYAKALPDGTYTLYGNTAYYVAVTPKVTNGCVVGGCSSQLCGEEGEDLVSTCEWTEKYSCYQTAVCERQPSGQCGWTETAELLACFERTTQSTN